MPSRSTHPRCDRCLQRGDPCLCAEIVPVRARVEIVILRHAAEALKQSGTARWAALALDCSVIDYAASEAPFDEGVLPLEDAWVLFPSGEPSAPPSPPPRRLLVPDGTWQQARRMVQRLPRVRVLPKLVLGAAPEGPRLRQPHLAEGRSTLEAIAAALALCGESGPAEQLRGLHQAVLRRTEKNRGPWKYYGQ